MYGAGCKIGYEDVGCRIQDKECMVKDTGYGIKMCVVNLGRRIQDTGNRLQKYGAGYRI